MFIRHRYGMEWYRPAGHPCTSVPNTQGITHLIPVRPGKYPAQWFPRGNIALQNGDCGDCSGSGQTLGIGQGVGDGISAGAGDLGTSHVPDFDGDGDSPSTSILNSYIHSLSLYCLYQNIVFPRGSTAGTYLRQLIGYREICRAPFHPTGQWTTCCLRH